MFLFLFFFFKQKTAYEMRISDWSSDVCSSDLIWQHSSRNARREASRTTGCGRAPSACSRSCADTLRSMPPSGLASASFGPELAARADIILDAGLRAERVDRAIQFLLPDQRLHCDMHRVILDGQRGLIDRAAVGRAHIMGVLRPTGRGQHQIAYAPFVDLSLDDALAAIADEIIIDRRRAVAMPAQDRRRRIAARAAGHRGEEAMGGAVATLGGRIVEQIGRAQV